MFADFVHQRISPKKPATKLSKIDTSLRTRQNPTLVINLTKIGSSLSQEKNTGPTQGTVRFRGIHNIRDSFNSSTEINHKFTRVNTKLRSAPADTRTFVSFAKSAEPKILPTIYVYSR